MVAEVIAVPFTTLPAARTVPAASAVPPAAKAVPATVVAPPMAVVPSTVVPAANVLWLAERKEADTRIRDRSTTEALTRELSALAQRAGAQDRILIVLFGHGSYDAGVTRVGLPGPDMSAADFAQLLGRFGERRIAVVVAASASGGFVEKLAAPQRIASPGMPCTTEVASSCAIV